MKKNTVAIIAVIVAILALGLSVKNTIDVKQIRSNTGSYLVTDHNLRY